MFEKMTDLQIVSEKLYNLMMTATSLCLIASLFPIRCKESTKPCVIFLRLDYTRPFSASVKGRQHMQRTYYLTVGTHGFSPHPPWAACVGPLWPDGSVPLNWAPHGFGQVPLHAWALHGTQAPTAWDSPLSHAAKKPLRLDAWNPSWPKNP